MGKVLEMNSVNVFIRHEDWVRFEFTTKEEVFVEEMQDSTDTFGLEIRNNGEVSVFVVSSEGYWIHENVTHLFNVNYLIYECQKVNTSEINHTAFYVDWLNEANEELHCA